MKLPLALTVLLAALVLAGCNAPGATTPSASVPTTAAGGESVGLQSVSGSAGAVGGSVSNSAPTVLTFVQSATTGENRGGFVVVFSGQVKDKNTERDVKNISITGIGPSILSSSHEITDAERSATSDPGGFGGDNWKVWTGTVNDGVLNYAFQRTFPAFTPAGTYAFAARVQDSPAAVGLSSSLSVILTAFSDITINPTPVDAAGNDLTGQNWGQWTAEAGAQNVTSSNYIKLVNTGDIANARIVIDLAPQFVGASDANFTIPVASNVQFAWFDDSTPAASAPSEGTLSYLTPNADGTVTVQFAGKGDIIYVAYRIVALPEILTAQSYGISFTVTEL